MVTGFRQTAWIVTGLIFALLVMLMPVSGLAAEQVSLKYGWQKGQQSAYRIKIEVSMEDYSELMNGVEQYAVIQSDADSFTVRCTGKLASITKSKDPRRLVSPLRMMRHRSPFAGLSSSMAGAFEQHELKLNRSGEIDTVKGSSLLPYLIGHLSQISLIPLSPEGKTEWSESEKTSVSIISSDRFPSPFRGANVEKTMGAKESTEYKITEENGDEVTIAVTHSYQTVSTVDGDPEIELSGTGTVHFDRKLGAVKDLQLNYKMYRRTENSVHKIPITISSQQLSQEELERFRADQAALAKQHQEKMKQREAALQFEIPQNIEADLKPILADLATKNIIRRKEALKKLSQAKPAKESPEVSAILIQVLNSKDITMVKDASEALVVWSTKEDVPAMIALLPEINILGLENLIDAILKHKTPEGLAAVAGLMSDPIKAHKTAPKLIAYGSEAEEPVLQQMEPSNLLVLVGVLRVLKEIGTEKTLKKIEEIKRTTDDRHFQFHTAATVKAIQDRIDK